MTRSVVCSFMLGSILFAGCGGEVSPSETTSRATLDQAVSTVTPAAHGCGDHADDDSSATEEARVAAATRVSWRSKKPKRNPIVQARILGFNDFHGQLPEGRRVANRPVGGAAVLASYLKSAAWGFEGRSLIIHAGDHVGASRPNPRCCKTSRRFSS